MKFLSGDTELDVDARAAAAWDVAEIAPGSFLLARGDEREVFHCVRAGGLVHLWWRGRSWVLEEAGEARGASHRAPAGALEAPMPGKVIAVRKKPGDPVSKGEEILIVEAMKMENAIRAPRDGRVKSVAAKVGDMVAPGAVLVELE